MKITNDKASLPLVLCGPLLRRITPHRLTLWLASSEPVEARLKLFIKDQPAGEFSLHPQNSHCRELSAGKNLYYLLIDQAVTEALPCDEWIAYELELRPRLQDSAAWQGLDEWGPGLCYPGQSRPGFIIASRVNSLLHGSCRKPHHDGGDALAAVDQMLAGCLDKTNADSSDSSSTHKLSTHWPAMLVMTGDQVYADDVAGPMLHAIHQLAACLQIPSESLPESALTGVSQGHSLHREAAHYYHREQLLPRYPHTRKLMDILFSGVEKPIFTSDSARNHLITLGEVLGMYLLVWSPAAWQVIDLEPPPELSPEDTLLYRQEREALRAFVATLPAVRRVLAHLPSAMIFDDHDVTDDWNLSREWEEIAYQHDFSRRVISNALIGYLLNQGWGNAPENFSRQMLENLQSVFDQPGEQAHEDFIESLLRFEQWHYRWPSQPPLVVIDSRTRRWRSEVAAGRPSGLLDWEGLTDLQHELRNLSAVLLVSPAPIFGVKLIEAIQRVFTWLGKPLLVDAENWMAHPGAANAILNIFRHRRTPQHFVLLSGDVHYSFVYDVEMRGRQGGPDIWQICSSGMHNEFPPRLLKLLDHANRWLYSPRSPLNWLTRRRRMRVIPRKPEGTPHGRRLLNGNSIGMVELNEEGIPWRIRELMADGHWVVYSRREEESRWD